MTARAGVVVVETRDRVEPEQPADVGEPMVDGSAETSIECRLDAPGEAEGV